jgi:hypothetical protein
MRGDCDELLDELGFFKLNDEIMAAYERAQNQMAEFRNERQSLLKKIEELNHSAILYVEGITDKTIIETAWNKLYPSSSMPFIIEPRDKHQHVRIALNTESSYRLKPALFQIGLFDFDSGFSEWNGLKDTVWSNLDCDEKAGLLKKRNNGRGYGLVLPVPDFRSHQAGSQFGDNSILTIELLFNDEILSGNIAEIINRPNPDGSLKRFAGNKSRFAEKSSSFSPDEFVEFEKLFSAIQSIINGDFK